MHFNYLSIKDTGGRKSDGSSGRDGLVERPPRATGDDLINTPIDFPVRFRFRNCSHKGKAH